MIKVKILRYDGDYETVDFPTGESMRMSDESGVPAFVIKDAVGQEVARINRDYFVSAWRVIEGEEAVKGAVNVNQEDIERSEPSIKSSSRAVSGGPVPVSGGPVPDNLVKSDSTLQKLTITEILKESTALMSDLCNKYQSGVIGSYLIEIIINIKTNLDEIYKLIKENPEYFKLYSEEDEETQPRKPMSPATIELQYASSDEGEQPEPEDDKFLKELQGRKKVLQENVNFINNLCNRYEFGINASQLTEIRISARLKLEETQKLIESHKISSEI